ncbi:MAG: FAD-dependent oxidoreductase, partial [Dehalococcoidia bacterium]|nr:FAD-dependent oxidoreductase [Dehalococcoidia bacterium]
VEVPMGIKLANLVYDIGGGIPKNKKFKAVQTGGPSGGCLPADMLGSPVDYETLAAAGSILGSGGMVISDEDTCMVDLARYFLSFTQAESCGKCPPCRVGTRQMLSILERITKGQGVHGDIEKLEKLAGTIKQGSLCGLGQTAPNPVLTTLKYFRDEYEEHIYGKHCRAATCKGLVKAPCSHTCPAEIDVPRYVRFILQGKFGEAVAAIREKVPFPGVLGRVCFHPCESKCRRGEIDEAIDIKNLKRIAADHDTGLWKKNSFKYPASGKKVAVVGSGPAGLTAAYYLAKLGHAITVFESLPLAGGMMRVGIPEYRLPRHILDSEIEEIKDAGVNIKTNAKVDSLKSLLDEGFSAIFLAIGAHKGTRMGIPGEDLRGVMECVDFLRKVNLGEKMIVGSSVGIIGGGNAAIDSARTALRLGATIAVIIYRRSRDEMPANPEEVEEASKEGVKFEYLANPNSITRDGSKFKVQITRMKLGEFDASGRRKPEPVAGSQFNMEFDNIIEAIGQSPDIPPAFELTRGRGNIIKTDFYDMTTSVTGIFAGGDCAQGPSSVIEAISDGRKGAIAIDRFLGGRGELEERLAPSEDLSNLPVIAEGEKQHRPKHKSLPLKQRLSSFAEVEAGLSRRSAMKEAGRCLRCDLENR